MREIPASLPKSPPLVALATAGFGCATVKSSSSESEPNSPPDICGADTLGAVVGASTGGAFGGALVFGLPVVADGCSLSSLSESNRPAFPAWLAVGFARAESLLLCLG